MCLTVLETFMTCLCEKMYNYIGLKKENIVKPNSGLLMPIFTALKEQLRLTN